MTTIVIAKASDISLMFDYKAASVPNQAKALWLSLSGRSDLRGTGYPRVDDQRLELRQEARLCDFQNLSKRRRDIKGRVVRHGIEAVTRLAGRIFTNPA
jgi:hypothetical protein